MRGIIPRGAVAWMPYDAGMLLAEVVLVLANLVYATSYVTTRLTLGHVGPATLALARLLIGAAILVPLAAVEARPAARPLSAADRAAIAAMGVVGFAGAFGLANWGIAWSSATNAALLIVVEPVAIMVLSPGLLGERLSPREWAGAAVTLAGVVLIVADGVPGLTGSVTPHWQGDLILVLAGLGYASYSLIGRGVLSRHPALPVTAWSLAWGAAAMLPIAAGEWAAGTRPDWSPAAVWGVLYLGVVITALGYLVWNWGLGRVRAPRAALYLNLQPLAGALLGVALLGEALTVFVALGGVLVMAGLSLTVKPGPAR
jgi:drug/metabolite transporter (DMT)-like permease